MTKKALPTNRDHKWVYLFTEGNTTMKMLLGGKGANVAEMTNIGLPVPPGFTITTETCNAFYDYSRQFPEGMWTQAQESLKVLEKQTKREFGNPKKPLLVSVRSGASISMPGMMDTVLNLGLNDETVVGLAKQTKNERFAYDSYRRFISMFGHIVMGVQSDRFDFVLDRFKSQNPGGKDTDLSVAQLKDIIAAYKNIIFAHFHGEPFPQDPLDQLRMAISAVFESWMRRRAIDYRRIHRIPDTLGTAVNVQAMVFGNMGSNSGTGVCFTRNPSTGENDIYGEYLLNAQGEDVVAGTRTPQKITRLARELPLVYAQLTEIITKLETHYRDMQDIEFTVEAGKLWILQTRTGKRTGTAAVRIAVEMVEQEMITHEDAVLRVDADLLNQLLHPMVDPKTKAPTLTTGLPASPGAATGKVSFDPDEAEELSNAGEPIILMRHETSPDDFHGMAAALAILTARGGMTSHAAVVARGMGTPCVVGAEEVYLDYEAGIAYVGETEIRAGDWITIDGSTGRLLLGKVNTIQPELGSSFNKLMKWADDIRKMQVRANADNGHDAALAREFGAEGIGLCRTEHMFMGEERLAVMREMILAEDRGSREKALDKLLPIQRQDFIDIFKAMQGHPVTIRLLDPPLHEFLPDHEQLTLEITDLKLSLRDAASIAEMDAKLKALAEKNALLDQVERLREANPMLGHRGCRLGLIYPEVTEMQARAIFQAASELRSQGLQIEPEVMVPLVSTAPELKNQREIVERVAKEVLNSYGMDYSYKIGTMIETPRAALTAGKVAGEADFFSFGTNDLTQTTFGLSRDDSTRFLPSYIKSAILPADPFQVLDQEGVGELIKLATQRGRSTKADLKVGICGEHGGEPQSIWFCNEVGLDYVSCSPYRVPIARLAAAQATLKKNAVA